MQKSLPTQNNGWPITGKELNGIMEKVAKNFSRALNQMSIGGDLSSLLETIYIPLAAKLNALAKRHKGTLIVGINGAQGSGKSTLCELLKMILAEGFESNVAAFSIDDIYLTRKEREELANEVHPLLQTRGVPGTHDVALGADLLKKLSQEQPNIEVAIPAFDKALDERRLKDCWQNATTPFDIILFEGWCVGTTPQEESELAKPVNALEAVEDPDGSWRRYVNKRLATVYAELFNMLDLLIMLRIPSMECVFEWRSLQERKLAEAVKENDETRIMDEKSLRRFVMHYERLTRHNLKEMPGRADIILEIDRDHQIEEMKIKSLPGQAP